MLRDITQTLRDAGLRVTQPRCALLVFLSQQTHPVGLRRIAAHMPDINLTTVYRMIDVFLEAGVVRGYDVGHGHTDYELADLPHHHHAICTACGLIEEIVACSLESELHKETLRASRQFSDISAHQSTFYGLCRTCAK
jgi:Fur family transcriptional regulator, ferric uptake regulator